MTALRERARAAVFAAGGRGFVRFLPAGETALLVSDAPRRCGDVPALLDGCRAAGFDARERDGLLLLTPTEAALRALEEAARTEEFASGRLKSLPEALDAAMQAILEEKQKT